MIAALIRHLSRFTAGLVRAAARRLVRPTTVYEPRPSADRRSAYAVAISGEEAEQLLAAALMAGLIEQAQYRESLTRLARTDDSRRPLRVPAS